MYCKYVFWYIEIMIVQSPPYNLLRKIFLLFVFAGAANLSIVQSEQKRRSTYKMFPCVLFGMSKDSVWDQTKEVPQM